MPVLDRPVTLVTGATGFVGSSLVESLVTQHGPDAVVALVRPELQSPEIERFERLRDLGIRILLLDLLNFPDPRPPAPEFDVVYHLAAYTQTETASNQVRVNHEGTRNFIEWLGPRLKGKRLIFTGLWASFIGMTLSARLEESTPCKPRTPYGSTKLAAENYIRARAAELGYRYTALRVCTVVGPGFRSGGMFSIFPRMLARGALATRLDWPGKTSIVSIPDLIRILRTVADEPRAEGELYLVSDGEDPSFDEPSRYDDAESESIRRSRIEASAGRLEAAVSRAMACGRPSAGAVPAPHHGLACLPHDRGRHVRKEREVERTGPRHLRDSRDVAAVGVAVSPRHEKGRPRESGSRVAYADMTSSNES